mmetsp:Transcript_33174/g.66927  ORF Transcript_33174/g.66927 Transcript_33174/m.66927 type:complete len:396 (-) Transcript_33174:38-1225(-)
MRYPLLACLPAFLCMTSSTSRAFALSITGTSRPSTTFAGGSKCSTRPSTCTPQEGQSTSCTLNPTRSHTSSLCHGSSRRRAIINAAFSLVSAPMVSQGLLPADPALASPPMTAGEADNVGARFERSMRKKPPKVLRNKLNQDFAVLLMRSSYNALDELDCVAMDQFQRDFFLIRSAEYLPYIDTLGPGAVKQGDLQDPYYFDFISFAQYATIDREMMDPPIVFQEQQPVEVGEGEPQKFVPNVVRRTVDTKLLPIKHSEAVGNKILNRLNDIFSGTEAAIPTMKPGSQPDSELVLKALKQLVVLFVINGFAFDGNAVISKAGKSLGSGGGTEFTVTLTSPATLWSGQALQLRRSKVTNDYFQKTARALLSRAGYDLSNATIKYNENQEITTFTIV